MALLFLCIRIVDAAFVGQYEGANGVAALATVAPIWNIIYSFGLLVGIGGAVLMSDAKGRGKCVRGNHIFTTAAILVSFVALFWWLIIAIYLTEILQFFWADATLLPLAEKYMYCIQWTVPLFVIGQFLAAFLRNDNAPMKATVAVLCGGALNIIGDYIFIFVLDMGIFGAGLATASGQVLSTAILCSHFFSRICSLHWTVPRLPRILSDCKNIVIMGFSTFFTDIAMGLLSIIFNRQIMHLFGAAALAVYGVVINISTLVQCCAYGVGQAAQPIISINLGARQPSRIKVAFIWAVITTLCVTVFWVLTCMSYPLTMINFFMKPSEEVLHIAPNILQAYFISFLFLPFNIFATYYFQAIMKPMAAFLISVLRGLVLSGGLLYLLPLLFGADYLWYSMLVAKGVVASIAIIFMMKYAGVMK